jgi:quercetin dioxygenase-like cupin family protein
MPTKSELMRRLESEAESCYAWSNGPNYRYAPHSHAYEKVLYCIDGSISFLLEKTGERLLLQAGDRMVLAPGTVHSAEVGPNGVTCIEGQR